MRKVTMLCLAGLLAALALAACDNTIRGVGRDLRETGKAVEDVAK